MTSQPLAAAKMATAELKPCPFCGGDAYEMMKALAEHEAALEECSDGNG